MQKLERLLGRKVDRRTALLAGLGLFIGSGAAIIEAIHLGQEDENPEIDADPSEAESVPPDKDVEARSRETMLLFADKPSVNIDFSQSGERLDPSIFNVLEGKPAGHDDEAQRYTASMVTIDDDVLTISAQATGNPDDSHLSGWVDTKGKLVVQEGYVEAEIMLAEGVGLWDAFWLRAQDTPHKDAATAEERANPYNYIRDGELDILENQSIQGGRVSSNVHTFESVSSRKNPNVGVTNVPDATKAFHKYGIAWTKQYISFLIDGREYHRYDIQPSDPFDHGFYIVLNQALGGKNAVRLAKEKNLGLENGIDDSTLPNAKMRIKNLKVFPLKENAGK